MNHLKRNENLTDKRNLNLLIGNLGNDVLTGGGGNDILWGDRTDGSGGGNDVFVFERSRKDNGMDTIKDYHWTESGADGAGQDVLDLSAALKSFRILHKAGADVDDYVWLEPAAGGLKLMVDQDGRGYNRGEQWAFLEGVGADEKVRVRAFAEPDASHGLGPFRGYFTLGIDLYVELGHSFRYTENREAGSFIGSVNAVSNNGISSFRFWNPATGTGSQTSPDGFFRIDDSGRIWLTAAGAASAANDADDANGPDNRQYLVQAADAEGSWSRSRTEVTLDDRNSTCDDLPLTHLIDIEGVGTQKREVEEGNILDRNGDLVGPVQAGLKGIRVVATGPDTSPEALEGDDGDAYVELTTVGTDTLLPDVTCIVLDAADEAKLSIREKEEVVDGALVYGDGLLSSLDRVAIVAGRNGEQGGMLYVRTAGAENVMPSLKAITVESLGTGDAKVDIESYMEAASVYDSDWNLVGRLNPGPRAGDNFMAALETVVIRSEDPLARAEFQVENAGGADFMRSLTSVVLDGGYGAVLDFNNTDQVIYDGNFDPIGYAGMGERFMEKLEVIDVRSTGDRGSDVVLETSFSDNFLPSLDTILLAGRVRKLELENDGGDNFMPALKTIDYTSEEAGSKMTLVLNNERGNYLNVDAQESADFLSALTTIRLSAEEKVDVTLINGLGPRYLQALESIDLDAGSGDLRLSMKIDRVDDETLGMLAEFSVAGGDIRADLDPEIEEAFWFGFDKFQGTADGVAESWEFTEYNAFANDSYYNHLIVLDGFDAGAIDDTLYFPGWLGITSGDLSVAIEGDNVRITYPTLGTGSTVLIGVADSFDAVQNLFVEVYP